MQRERIIEQAAKMFAEQGIKSIRMDDIAKALGVSKRTLYEMFEDKEELLYLSIRFMQSRRMAKMEAKLRENSESLAFLFDSAGHKNGVDGCVVAVVEVSLVARDLVHQLR